ncbi:hypothetical protein HKD37_08G021716 [Glycine soja]
MMTQISIYRAHKRKFMDMAKRKGPCFHCGIDCGKNPCLWYPNAPSRKRTRVVQMDITSIRRFHEQLLMMWKNDGNSNGSSQESEEVLLIDNVNNFIPSNEIGLGCILLKPEDASA